MFGEPGLNVHERQLKLIDQAKIQASDLTNRLSSILNTSLANTEQIGYLQDLVNQQRAQTVELKNQLAKLTETLRTVKMQLEGPAIDQVLVIKLISQAIQDK